jgi:DNA-binding NtrC family response regulator
MHEKNKPRIFMVDDEPAIASTLELILNAAGFSAASFTNPLEALRSAETQCPDFLLSDVMMPQLNGIDLGVQFKAIYPRCRIKLLSGQIATGALMGDARKKGHSFELLAKPIHPKDLLDVIGQPN